MTTIQRVSDVSGTSCRAVVLLVDDEPNVLTGLARALHGEAFAILTATSAMEALATLARESIDVIVADQDMPGMKGTELLQKVAATYPDTMRFMLTGRPSLDVAIHAINEGAIRGFFTKPTHGAELAAALRQAIAYKSLLTEAWRLLQLYRRQEMALASLEQTYPGIAEVKVDQHGSIELESPQPGDYEQLIEALRAAGK